MSIGVEFAFKPRDKTAQGHGSCMRPMVPFMAAQ
jgi:hypothetical protein